jgi:hypothetical protein
MGMNILIQKESEDDEYVFYKFGLDSNENNKLKINKITLEFEKVGTSNDTLNYVFFKAGAYIKRQYEEKGIFPENTTCAS